MTKFGLEDYLAIFAIVGLTLISAVAGGWL
jgi:hypothetical protein